jgi:hypothetical protein
MISGRTTLKELAKVPVKYELTTREYPVKE